MAKTNRMILKSNFRVAAKAGDEVVAKAIKEATDEMEKQAQISLERGNQRRGYNIGTDHIRAEHSDKDGRIWFDEFWGRFFEYGTVYIPAMSFMRPGHRKGRAKLKDVLQDDFEKWVKRRAGM